MFFAVYEDEIRRLRYAYWMDQGCDSLSNSCR